jgi:hypothetical protein
MTPTAAIDFGTLCDELDALIAGPPARDDATRADVERTLTDGYARAHSSRRAAADRAPDQQDRRG